MNKIFLALGSNVGDRAKYIGDAVALLGEKIDDVRSAPVYESKAVGYTDQPDFLNTVIEGFTALSPEELLNFTQATEKKVGRIPRFRWGPREIDIDILFYDDLVIKSDRLQIPHPRLQERHFVLVPLQNLVPDFTHPSLSKTVQEMLEALSPAEPLLAEPITAGLESGLV